MTTIRFFRTHDRLTGFSCVGHSGYAPSGEDIVCAAVTSAIRLTECLINDVHHGAAEVAVDRKTAAISLRLSPSCKAQAACEAVLSGLFLYMSELSNENPDHLTVLEV